jgi:dTDP-glucose 4,6-dehydratase
MKNILITGGAGFIGSNYINHLLSTDDESFVVNLDKLTYAGNLENLKASESKKNYRFVLGDITNIELVNYLFDKYKIKYVINFAAESHVDRSILGSGIFYQTNVIGTNVLLEAARKFEVEKFLQVSTDEVYGSLGKEGLFTETTPLSPSSPYSSSKAAADLMCIAFHRTFKFPVVITRCSNNYGPYQFPEKLIPLMIINALKNQSLPVYGDGLNVRDWIYVLDHNEAIRLIFERGKAGEVYNIGSSNEMTNLQIVNLVLKRLNKSSELIKFVKDRPGHDKRYAIDSSKLRNEFGWKPKYDFSQAIDHTIDWYIRNQNWWENIVSGSYKNYYSKQYNNR